MRWWCRSTTRRTVPPRSPGERPCSSSTTAASSSRIATPATSTTTRIRREHSASHCWPAPHDRRRDASSRPTWASDWRMSSSGPRSSGGPRSWVSGRCSAEPSGRGVAPVVVMQAGCERRADGYVREERRGLGRRRDPFDEEAIDDERPDIARDDRTAAFVGDRGARERDHRVALEHAGHRVGAGLRVEAAEDEVGPDAHLEAVRLERDSLLLGATWPGGDDREQVRPFDGDAVDRGHVTVGEADAFDVMESEPVLPVEEVGQALTEHRHLAGDRAVDAEPEEIDPLHGGQR